MKQAPAGYCICEKRHRAGSDQNRANTTWWNSPDFAKGDPEPDKIITERFTERTRPHNINERLILLPGNHFDLVNPVCPFCGSNHVIKQEYYERNPILGEFGPRLSRYVVLARFWLLPARCRFSQIQYQADARFTSRRLNFASNHWQSLQ